MRICLVHEEYPEETNFGGIATYQKNVAEELVKKGNIVYVICRGLNENQNYIENGVKISRIFVKRTNNQIKDYIAYRKIVAKKLLQLQEQDKIDIIETPDWGAETVYFENKRKIPLVVRLHTPLKVWLKYNKNDFGKVTKKMLKWEEKMILSADYITCCSNALKLIMSKEFKIKKEIIVTPNPANINDFYYDKQVKKENKLLFVGSIEERKGAIVLAKALNIVFKKYPELKIDFIGKDTTRNKYNISTKKVIENIVNPEYMNNINFLGQVPNIELNKHFNKALIGIFPSLFDNFPYVVLESMATGLHIVGSSNSGMVEMLEDDSSIYKSGDYIDLANRIIEKYEFSKKEKIAIDNIKKVKEKYNSDKICNELLHMYGNIIKEYYKKNISKNDLHKIINSIINTNVISYKEEKGGVANIVYRVKTSTGYYIIKKYLYDYDFDLSNELYNIYNNHNINSIYPLNKEPINYNSLYYNIFPYKKKDLIRQKIDLNLLAKIATCNNEEFINNEKTSINNKCDKYYNYLISNKSFKKSKLKKEIEYVLKNYKDICKSKIVEEKYLKHGDISTNNLISSNKKIYVIDFDETCIAPKLYDYAVIVIKIFTKNGIINTKEYNKFQSKISKCYKEYNDKDYKNIIKYYLCKVLLEKFYYHEKNIIDLFSKKQLKDNYKYYLKLLSTINN